jgi:hypothetical protein
MMRIGVEALGMVVIEASAITFVPNSTSHQMYGAKMLADHICCHWCGRSKMELCPLKEYSC